MGSLPFRIDLEDIRFVLFDQLNLVSSLQGVARYADFDQDTLSAALEEAARLATEVLHPINAPGDREGCKLDADGNVTTPAGYREAWKAVAEGGFVNVAAPPDAGGVGMPQVMYSAVTEMFIQASMAFTMYPGLTAGAARLLYHHAPDSWRLAVASRMYSGQWSGTMCLTEAGAGSDVGENRCKATPHPTEPDVFLLEGEKIFISGGDSDLAENVIHLVLARTPGSPKGTKGLSLFMVPKFLFDEEGTLGERNGAKVVGIEEKMGIHGSATCTLALGADRPCRGWMVGAEHQGIEIMFMMMNEARIGVGAQGVGVAAASYQFALAYSHQRLQGSSPDQLRNPDAPRMPIVIHPDVRRMLMTQKVLAETMRSLLYRLGHRHDLMENFPDRAEVDHMVIDLLVPVLKAHCTDMGFEASVLGIQVLGGYGYIGEYPVEQLARDAKIASIYEGTNGIQALDLLGRKMRIKGGAYFMQWMQEAGQILARGKEAGFAAEAGAIEKAVQQLGASAMHLGGLGMQGKMEAALLQAYPFLQQFGTVQLGLEALDQALVAQRVIAERGATPHLESKRLNLAFYVANLLPRATSLGKGLTQGDTSCLDPILFAAT